MAAIRSRLMPMAYVITPNIPEAETLLDMKIETIDAMKRAAELIVEMGAAAVLLKGGHMSGQNLTDVLLDESGFYLFETERIDTLHTHGTGCSIASAVAVGIAQGLAVPDAVRRAQAYVAAAIRSAPGYGGGSWSYQSQSHFLTIRCQLTQPTLDTCQYSTCAIKIHQNPWRLQ